MIPASCLIYLKVNTHITTATTTTAAAEVEDEAGDCKTVKILQQQHEQKKIKEKNSNKTYRQGGDAWTFVGHLAAEHGINAS